MEVSGSLPSHVCHIRVWTPSSNILYKCIRICTNFSTTVCIVNPRPKQFINFSFKDLTIVMYTSDSKGPRGGSPNSELYSLALMDAAPFYTMLCSSAAYMSLLTGTSELGEGERYKLEAIHLLNLRLQDPKEAVTDVVIAAVTSLATIEVNPAFFAFYIPSNPHPVRGWKSYCMGAPYARIDRYGKD
jgi:hypothetical protein